MEQPNHQQVDVDALVRERFEQYLGSVEGKPLENQVIAEAGVDSIVLVMILTDLFVEINVDVGETEVKLAEIKTLADVVALVRSMLAGAPISN